MGKVEKLASDVGRKAAEDLARRAEAAILATGDRLMCSCFGTPTRDYERKKFRACSKNVKKCFEVVGATIGMADIPTSFKHPDPIVKGEMMIIRSSSPDDDDDNGGATKSSGDTSTPEPLRLLTSQYRQLYTVTNAKWRETDYWKVSDVKIKQRVNDLLSNLLRAYCKSKSIDQKTCQAFIGALLGDIDKHMSTEHGHSTAEAMTLILWTSPQIVRVGKRKMELCSILNEIIRSDGTNPAFEFAVKLICMIQHFLNAGRRDSKFQMTPGGPTAAKGSGWSTTENVVYRGSTLPEKHLAFFKTLAGTGRWYRAAHLVATSFDRRTANGFLQRADPSEPKVRWTVRLNRDYKCVNVNYIDNKLTAVKDECEYLFSAYSAFKVIQVIESDDPTDYDTPHEIIIEATYDNARVPESVPTAPWC